MAEPEITSVDTPPGETFHIRCASATTKVRVCFADGTEIAVTIGPGQDIAVTRGTEMTPEVFLEEPDRPMGTLSLVEPDIAD